LSIVFATVSTLLSTLATDSCLSSKVDGIKIAFKLKIRTQMPPFSKFRVSDCIRVRKTYLRFLPSLVLPQSKLKRISY
jgi:hypothetical protein